MPSPLRKSPKSSPSQVSAERSSHALQSFLERTIRLPKMASRISLTSPTKEECTTATSKITNSKTKTMNSDVKKETKKAGMLRRIESGLHFKRTTAVAPSRTAPDRSPPAVSKGKEVGQQSHEVEAGRPPGFIAPSLRQATMSTPILHLTAQADPATSSRPGTTSSSAADVSISPRRDRRANVQQVSRDTGTPTPLAPRRTSRDSSRPPKPKPPPLTSISTSSLSNTLHGHCQTPETPTRKAREPLSPPATPTPVSHRAQLSSVSSHRRASLSSTHLPSGSSPPSPIQPRSPSRTHTTTSTTPRGLRSTSASNLPLNHTAASPTARRSSVERRGSDDSPSRTVTPTPIRPRCVSPSAQGYGLGKVSNMSTTSLCTPSTPEQRELIRKATTILCKELVKPPPHLTHTGSGAREWEETEVRIRPLARSQRMWGRSGGISSGSSTQVNAPDGLGVSVPGATTEERERRMFSEALQDGFVLCQLLNKLRSAAVIRPDPREDGFSRTSNVTKFLAACKSYGLPSARLFLHDDLIESTAESLARVAKTVITLVQQVESPILDKEKHLRGQGRQDPAPVSSTNFDTTVYSRGRSRAAASTPNLSLDTAQGLSSPSSPRSPIRKKVTPSPVLSTVDSDSPGDSSRGVGDQGSSKKGNDRDVLVTEARHVKALPPKSPLRARSPTIRAEEASPTLSSSRPNVEVLHDRLSLADSTRASLGNSSRASIADPRNAARQSVASSNLTDLTAFSSMFDVRLQSVNAPNKFGTIRTVTTEQTEPPSLTRAEGTSIAAVFADEGARTQEQSLEEHKPSDSALADLSRVAEETEDAGAGTTLRRTVDKVERESESRADPRVERPQPIHLGKGKWPDDFLEAFQAHRTRPTSIKQSATTDRDEGSITGPSISGPRKLAAVGRQDESSESLPQLLRRASHRPRHSIDTPSSLLPKEPRPRDASPDAVPSPFGMARRHSTNRSPHRSGMYIPRGLDDPRQNFGQSADSLVPFPRAVSGDHRAHSASPALPSEHRNSPVPSDQPRPPRGRFQSENEGQSASARRRGRPYSYDELGARPAQRVRFESMINLGVASSRTSASDYRGSPESSPVRKTLTIKEEGKPPTQYQLGNCIGRGQFGSVYRALNRNTGETVAVKCIRLDGLKEEEVTQLMREVDLVKRLSHPSIVKYEGMARDVDTLSIVLEYAENGSLGQTLKAFGKLNERLVASYVVKILEGLHYLHQSDVVHCDLKAANILTTKTGNVKLSDFGVSLNLRTVEREIKDVAGTPNWMAPEVIELKGASPKSDIWSLACTVIELLTGRPPYAEIANNMSVMWNIVEDEMPPIPEGCSEALRDFLKLCFRKDPAKRPSAEFLFEHSWLKKNWGVHKELRPQDSIPFLRRVSADLQKNDAVRYLAQREMSESPVDDSCPRTDAIVNGSPPKLRGLLNPPAAPFLISDNDALSPPDHTFVESTFKKAMICKVCSSDVKKNAVVCQKCSLIAHAKCSKSAPPTCDLRAQYLYYAHYAERGEPASVYSNQLNNSSGGSPAIRPTGPASDISHLSQSPKTGVDGLRSPPPPRSTQSAPAPLKSKVTNPPTSSSHKLFPFRMRSRTFSLEPTQASTSARPLRSSPERAVPLASNEHVEEQTNQRPRVLRRTKERPVSVASSGATRSSTHSTTTPADSLSSRYQAGRSDLGTRTSGSRFSMLADTEGQHSLQPTEPSEEQANAVPGGFEDNPRAKKHRSKPSGSGCTIQ